KWCPFCSTAPGPAGEPTWRRPEQRSRRRRDGRDSSWGFGHRDHADLPWVLAMKRGESVAWAPSRSVADRRASRHGECRGTVIKLAAISGRCGRIKDDAGLRAPSDDPGEGRREGPIYQGFVVRGAEGRRATSSHPT